MARCRAMIRRRSAAISLLVLCLAVGAVSPFAPLEHSVNAGVPERRLGVSAPDAALACVLANKPENGAGSELQPAIVGLPNSLRLFRGDGDLLHSSDGGRPPAAIASAAYIRGPPQPARI